MTEDVLIIIAYPRPPIPELLREERLPRAPSVIIFGSGPIEMHEEPGLLGLVRRYAYAGAPVLLRREQTVRLFIPPLMGESGTKSRKPRFLEVRDIDIRPPRQLGRRR